MKICLLARHFGLEGAGIGRVALELYNGLVKRGHEVTKLEVKGDELSEYFKFTFCDIPRNLPKADVYHAVSPMEAIWLPKNKSVVTFHDLFLMTHPDRTGAGLGRSRIKRTFGRWYFGFACRQAVKCRFVTCNTEQTKVNIKKYLNADAQIVMLGVSSTLEPKKKTDSIFRIGYLGQLDKRKRVDLLVKAFHESTLNGELVIVGKGGDRPMLEKLADGDRRIKFLGFLPDDRLCEFYNSIDYFCWPSGLEGFSLPVIEAFACKKPVITLWDAVIPDEVKSRTISVGCFEAFFQNTFPNYDNIEDNYRFAKSYSWDEFVERHIALYEVICS